MVCREIKQRLTDLDKMFTPMDRECEVADAPGAQPLVGLSHSMVRFENVQFSYDSARSILNGISFEIPVGKTEAVVGPSGSGKSTRGRRLFCCSDIQQGGITMAGQEMRKLPAPGGMRLIGVNPNYWCE